jgi:hypothetical protein
MKLRLIGLLLVLLISLGALPVFAHEGREVGEYVIVFGWRAEPALAGLFNGPEISIATHDGELTEDVPVSLQAEVSFGSESRTVTFDSSDEAGHYIADLIPTLPGDYNFRIFGTIGETAVDEMFSSADGEFSTVEPANDIMFPQAGIVDVAALLARIEALEARLAELDAQ